MYLDRIRVEDVKSFHGERRVDLSFVRPDGTYPGWTVLAGRNGSGKTTLLRAIALAVAGPATARSLVTDFSSWISRDQPFASSTVRLTHGTIDGFVGTGRRPVQRFSTGLRWMVANEPGPGGRAADQPSLAPTSGSKGARGPWADNPVGWFCAGYGPFRRLAGGSNDVQRLMLRPATARLASLFHEDASLAEGVSWLIEQHLRDFEDRPGAALLKSAALAVLGDGLLPDGAQVQSVDSEGLWVASGSHRYPLSEMSDGYRTVAALVVDILKQMYDAYGVLGVHITSGRPTVNYPGVVIIDEIDAHLHVSWQKRIGGWLTEHFPAIQFIVTTHSPYICQSADPGGLISLPGVDEDRPPSVVSTDVYDRVVYGSGDDAILSELFGMETLYSDRAEQDRSELVALELRVLRGEADPLERERYEVLSRRLISSPVARTDEIAARLLGQSRAHQ